MARRSFSIRKQWRKRASGSKRATTFCRNKISTSSRRPSRPSQPKTTTEHAGDYFLPGRVPRSYPTPSGGEEAAGGGEKVARIGAGRGPGQGGVVSPGQRYRPALRLLSTVAKEGAFFQTRPRGGFASRPRP